MRVLAVGNMYPPQHLGGYELVWQSAVRALREAGHEVRVLTTDVSFGDREEEDDDVHRELRWYWRDHEFPSIGVRERIAIERGNRDTFRRHLAEVRPDAISWWAMGGMSLSLLELGRRAAIPAMAAVNDDWLLYGSRVDAWQRLCQRLGPAAAPLARAAGIPGSVEPDSCVDRWVVLSETVLSRARSAGLVMNRARVSPSGIDEEIFTPTTPPADWAWRLLYVGRIDPRKGIDLAIGALSQLPDAELRIHGPGDERYLKFLRGLITRLGLGDRVSFSSSGRGELPGVYAAADAVLFPVTWEEPWGLVPLEAMAVGRPVVASGRGGSGEYLEDGVNCVIVDPDDGPAALASALRRLADDRDLRDELVEAGRRTAARFPESHSDQVIREEVEALG